MVMLTSHWGSEEWHVIADSTCRNTFMVQIIGADNLRGLIQVVLKAELFAQLVKQLSWRQQLLQPLQNLGVQGLAQKKGISNSSTGFHGPTGRNTPDKIADESSSPRRNNPKSTRKQRFSVHKQNGMAGLP